MSQRRMFSPQIIDSDAFLDMSTSAQSLYFHLGMRADDDGFVGNPKKILKMIGGNDDDLKILIAKRFVLIFDSGVIVIKHWRINNLVRKDWYKETAYIEEKNQLIIKENGAYTELVNESLTNRQHRLGKVRLGKVNKIISSEPSSPDPVKEIFKAFYENGNKGINFGNRTERAAADWLVKQYGLDKAIETIKYALSLIGKPYAPVITTPFQLKNNLTKLMAYYKRENNNQTIII